MDRIFRLIKFRTMYVDGDIRLAELVQNNDLNPGRLLELESDPRVTPVGRVLRKYSLNEFPQLINVLTGSMYDRRAQATTPQRGIPV